MSREEMLASLRALHASLTADLSQRAAGFATVEASQRQVEVCIAALELEAEEPGPDACPRCGANDWAEAGADDQHRPVRVCGSCNANVAAGQVIGG